MTNTNGIVSVGSNGSNGSNNTTSKENTMTTNTLAYKSTDLALHGIRGNTMNTPAQDKAAVVRFLESAETLAKHASTLEQCGNTKGAENERRDGKNCLRKAGELARKIDGQFRLYWEKEVKETYFRIQRMLKSQAEIKELENTISSNLALAQTKALEKDVQAMESAIFNAIQAAKKLNADIRQEIRVIRKSVPSGDTLGQILKESGIVVTAVAAAA